MKKINMKFLSSVLVLCGFGINGAIAAPSVKMLGANTARIGNNATVVKSESNSLSGSTQRLGTIRPKTVGSGTPVVVNKVLKPATTTTSAGAADDSRLSLGKYIHSTGTAAGTIKPANTVPITASTEFIDLVDRVSNLESSVETVLDEGFADLPARVNDLQDDVDSLTLAVNGVSDAQDNYYTKQDVYTKQEVAQMIQQQMTGTTYDSITTENKTYDSINVADEFDEGFNFVDNNG